MGYSKVLKQDFIYESKGMKVIGFLQLRKFKRLLLS
jgi:hypothetical protein